MNIVECSQGDMDWFLARTGRVTASDVAKTMAFRMKGEKKGEPLESRNGYMASIIGEILTGEPDMDIGGYLTDYMRRGIDEEDRAREVYAVVSDVEVQRVGFVIHPTIERAGASPDGIVSGDGMVEIKCPKSKTHIAYMLTGVLPEEYEPQVMFELACTGLEWCDFVSYDSRMPRRHRMFIKRVYRDEERIAEINAAVLQFLAEADSTIERLNRLNPESEISPKEHLKEQLRRSLEPDPNDEALITDEEIEWAKARTMPQPEIRST